MDVFPKDGLITIIFQVSGWLLSLQVTTMHPSANGGDLIVRF